MPSPLARIPLVGPAVARLLGGRGGEPAKSPEPAAGAAGPAAKSGPAAFTTSGDYWRERYRSGRNSGAGSYGELAAFKADFLNRFVKDRGVESVVEFGSGDGNQLTLAEYPAYLGLDISPEAVAACRERFAGDPTKRFALPDESKPGDERADLSLSLDVIYHLTEDAAFGAYMRRLFDAGERFVIVFASNGQPDLPPTQPHVRHRKFTDWVDENRPDWRLTETVPNAHPFDPATGGGSFADFYVYERAGD